MKNIFIFGSSGHFKEQFVWLKDSIKASRQKIEIRGIIDDKNYNKIDQLTKLKIYKSNKIKYDKNIFIYIAVGNINIRKIAIKKFSNFNFFSLNHPSAIVSEFAKLGKATTLSPNCVVAGNAKLDDYNNLNTATIISHDCHIQNNNSFGPGTKILGNCKIGNNNYFGGGAVMIPGTRIIDNNTIGANSTIVDNFKSNFKIIGSPGKAKS
jgi:sugar O-acyltransferase (sialic acid O-acetyltransferase NeuD family)